jgi:hypothetical protein
MAVRTSWTAKPEYIRGRGTERREICPCADVEEYCTLSDAEEVSAIVIGQAAYTVPQLRHSKATGRACQAVAGASSNLAVQPRRT